MGDFIPVLKLRGFHRPMLMKNNTKTLKARANRAMRSSKYPGLLGRVHSHMPSARSKSMLATAVCLTGMFSTMAMASPNLNSVGEKVNTGLESVFNMLRMVALPVGIVSLVACGIAYFFGGEKGMEAGKKWAFRVAIGLAIVGLAPLLITGVYNIFSETDTSGIFKK